jgi:hypothetical protein
MGLFSKKASRRSIPLLEPDYFEEIHERLRANGGSLTSTQIAESVANALYNTGSSYLARIDDVRGSREFEARFGERSPVDRHVPDDIVDFLVARNPAIRTEKAASSGRCWPA